MLKPFEKKLMFVIGAALSVYLCFNSVRISKGIIKLVFNIFPKKYIWVLSVKSISIYIFTHPYIIDNDKMKFLGSILY